MVQNLFKLLSRSDERRDFGRTSLIRPIALAMMLFPLVVVGAFGIAPQTDVDGVERHLVDQPVDISGRSLDPLAAQGVQFFREELVQKGDTLGQILGRLQVDDPVAYRFMTERGVRGLDKLTTGRAVKVLTDQSGGLLELRYRSDDGDSVIRRVGAGFLADTEQSPTERRVVMRSGTILSSLFAATDAAGVPDAVANAFADLFSGDVDLHRDLRRGDRFAILYEMIVVRGEEVGTGKILAAELLNQGVPHRAVYFEGHEGRGEFFTPGGRSMKRSFLRSPIEFSRVTSGFSSSRFHPVLQTWRAHKGIDYGAPIGARVRSTADGTVTFAGWRNGYGQVVMLRHNHDISTLYGHLSALAPGMRVGSRVEQGQVIGFVGMTGLASGPHLHYEFQVNGVQADPLARAPDTGFVVTSDLRPAFDGIARDSLAKLDLLRAADVVAFE